MQLEKHSLGMSVWLLSVLYRQLYNTNSSQTLIPRLRAVNHWRYVHKRSDTTWPHPAGEECLAAVCKAMLNDLYITNASRYFLLVDVVVTSLIRDWLARLRPTVTPHWASSLRTHIMDQYVRLLITVGMEQGVRLPTEGRDLRSVLWHYK